MEKILVTGSRGLLGSCFKGPEYIKTDSRDTDLRDPSQTYELFNQTNPTGVIHCAARVGGLMGNMNHAGEFFYDNIMINTNVIETARKKGVKKLISFLSTCVFPDKAKYPLTPSQINTGEPHDSNFAYAYAKRMADVQIQAYKKQYGTEYFSVIPSNLYGKEDFFDIKNGHVVPSLIHRIYLASRENKDIKIWGTGKPKREFIFNEDAAELTRMLYENYQGSEPVILSTSEETSIKDLVDIIADKINFNGKIIYDDSMPDGQMRKPSDNSVITSMFPDYKFTPLEEGIEKTVNWFLENYPNIRK